VRRLLALLRPKRLVRLHLPEAGPSFEGILLGRWGGHYVLRNARLLRATDSSLALDGEVRVPQERVLFVQAI
jgi:hypothetical protein